MSQPWDISIAPPSGGPVRLAGKASGQPSGGSTAGAARVLGPFPFAFGAAGLAAGLAVYTPTVGDIIVDAWIEVDEAWNGTTPKGDLGMFDAGTYGWYGYSTFPFDMTQADAANADAGLLQRIDPLHNKGSANVAATNYSFNVDNVYIRVLPAKVLVAHPVKVVVSQDGQAGGADPGASQGAGGVYLVVATPSLA